MSEIVQYINDNGVEIVLKKEISEPLPEFYFETYFENGKAKFEKQYENGELNNISFYAYSNDEIESILKDKKGNVFVTFIYIDRYYKITENLTFRENNIISKTITVQDQNEDQICFKKYELKNSDLVCTITDKSFYENGSEKFAFIYNDDGSCFMIDRVGAYQEDIFAWEIGTSETDFTWDGFEYYRNAEPLIP
ncbi:hypothetical protein [Chryseobacterium sp.]|uniref:hypothetical protein n=1 Tax=Chryseobacterium sp. TaxID=1871047 RepID=UPI002FC5F9D3